MSDDTKTIKASKDLIIELCGMIGYEEEGFICIQELPVEDEGKYQHESFIFLHVPSRKFYQFSCTRSGSYFSEYNYEYGEDKDNNVELFQVKIAPVEVFQWIKAK